MDYTVPALGSMRPAFVISFLFERFEVAPPAEGSTVEQELAAAGAHIAGRRTAEGRYTVEDTAVAVRQRQVADNSLGPVEHILAAHNPAEKDSIAVDTLAPADILDMAFAQAPGFRPRTARGN